VKLKFEERKRKIRQDSNLCAFKPYQVPFDLWKMKIAVIIFLKRWKWEWDLKTSPVIDWRDESVCLNVCVWERVCVYACVRVRERESEKDKEWVYMCIVCMREREKECVCVCLCDRGSVYVCTKENVKNQLFTIFIGNLIAVSRWN